jgi:hypothetical protein
MEFLGKEHLARGAGTPVSALPAVSAATRGEPRSQQPYIPKLHSAFKILQQSLAVKNPDPGALVAAALQSGDSNSGMVTQTKSRPSHSDRARQGSRIGMDGRPSQAPGS